MSNYRLTRRGQRVVNVIGFLCVGGSAATALALFALVIATYLGAPTAVIPR